MCKWCAVSCIFPIFMDAIKTVSKFPNKRGESSHRVDRRDHLITCGVPKRQWRFNLKLGPAFMSCLTDCRLPLTFIYLMFRLWHLVLYYFIWLFLCQCEPVPHLPGTKKGERRARSMQNWIKSLLRPNPGTFL